MEKGLRTKSSNFAANRQMISALMSWLPALSLASSLSSAWKPTAKTLAEAVPIQTSGLRSNGGDRIPSTAILLQLSGV